MYDFEINTCPLFDESYFDCCNRIVDNIVDSYWYNTKISKTIETSYALAPILHRIDNQKLSYNGDETIFVRGAEIHFTKDLKENEILIGGQLGVFVSKPLYFYRAVYIYIWNKKLKK